MSVFIILFLSFGACAPQGLSTVFTTQVDPSGRPLNQSSAFSVDTPTILCSVYVSGLPASAQVKASWLHFDGTAWRPVQENALTVAGSTYLVFSLNAPASGWQTGDYVVRLSVNNQQKLESRFSVQASRDIALPVVNNFTVTPSSVTLGQALTLSWNVSGASRVVIEPDIGNVEAGGNRAVTPGADTTYTLTALNGGGSTSATAKVTVVAPVTQKPDLVVVDVFRQVNMVYYIVRNDGSAASKPSSAKLYRETTELGSSYIPSLAPGEQRTLQFGSVSWSFLYPTPVSVCVDTASENDETTKANNCMIKVLPGVLIM